MNNLSYSQPSSVNKYLPVSDLIYDSKVILTNKNLTRKNKKNFLYPLMKIIQKDETEINLLLDKVIQHNHSICFEGSIESCETVYDKLVALKLDSIII